VSFEYKDPKSGDMVKAGGKADRNGFFFVNDRTNGKLLNAFPFVKQIDWAKGIDLKTGKPIYNEANRPGNPFADARWLRECGYWAEPEKNAHEGKIT
jgi:alcohol dehydrogenase (cytochrome c)